MAVADRGPSNDPGLLLMISLAGGPKHGHAMLLDIAEFAGVRLGPGTLYGALSRLEDDGHVAPLPSEGRRRPYRLTPGGRRALERRLGGLNRAVRTGLQRVRV
ncbi:MAG TPA: helix-turn-helix transcriptional regulator [Candidatus Limnocylindria bacterium]|nr:helix-turn-helix transcriptional regulator [Candidatus Limnocylindria bacterium]